jgi:hypothetical protein
MARNISTTGRCALLTDGTALFFAARYVSPDKGIDYQALWNLLAANRQIPSPFAPAVFFTASDPANEKQVRFHEMIGSIGWKLAETPPHEATINNPLLGDAKESRLVRFDALIAYTLAHLQATTPDQMEVIIITDSYPVAAPVRDAVARGARITIAFFGSLIDTRWHRLFREEDGRDPRLRFLDLELHANTLFSRPRATTSNRREALPWL